jgi:hypothetical protein
MNNWEKAKIVSLVLSTLLIPIVVAFVGSNYNKAITEREVQSKFVELAVNILSEKPDSTAGSYNIRAWATEIIDQYSGVKLSIEAKQNLIEDTPISKLPSQIMFNYDYNRDSIVNESDLKILRGYLGRDSSMAHYDQRFDIDNDGMISAADVAIFYGLFSKSQSSIKEQIK